MSQDGVVAINSEKVVFKVIELIIWVPAAQKLRFLLP